MAASLEARLSRQFVTAANDGTSRRGRRFMDALLVFRNEIRSISAKLMRSTATSLSLGWIGNERGEVGINLTRADNWGTYKWKLKPLLIGEKVSFLTATVTKADEPDEFLANAYLERPKRTKAKLPRAKSRKPKRARRIADLVCHVNNKKVCSLHLTTGNIFLMNYVWVGDRTGYALLHMGLGGSSAALRTPKIRFGDQIGFSILPLSSGV
jgi:hypothetical protein